MRENVNEMFRQTRNDISSLSLPVVKVWMSAHMLVQSLQAKYQEDKKKDDQKSK